MRPTVTILAPGNMGAAMGARLAQNGIEVRTSIDGRSQASVERAKAAGMRPVEAGALVDVDLFLSVVPPGSALATAEAVGALVHTAARKPVYVDCNAVSPVTAARIASVVEASGAPFVDAGIIGSVPREGYDGPRIYVSGPEAHQVAGLGAYGLDFPVLDSPIGAASALKMSYAGITKGVTAVAIAMILAAQRSDAAEALHAELSHSQPQFLTSFATSVPGSFDKAYRWVAEMREIAEFAGEDPAANDMYHAISKLYGRIAADRATEGRETGLLEAFLNGRRRQAV